MSRTVVKPRGSGLASLAFFSGAVGVLWLWLGMIAYRVGGMSQWLVFPVCVICAAVLGWVCWWAVKRRANEEPAMIIDEVGIFDNVSMAQAGRVKWREMERLWLAGPPWMQFLCIQPESMRDYMENQDEVRGIVMRINKSLMGAPVIVPMAILEMPPEDVWNRIALVAEDREAQVAPPHLIIGA